MVKKLPVFKDKPDNIAEFLIEYSDVSWGKFEKFVGTETPLEGRMKSAFEFRVTFENGTSVVGPLLDAANPEFDISCRMLYQLFTDKENVPWTTFADRLKSLPLYIEEVMDAVAKLKKIDNMEEAPQRWHEEVRLLSRLDCNLPLSEFVQIICYVCVRQQFICRFKKHLPIQLSGAYICFHLRYLATK
ncbi:Aste57867_23237 [Aphanomyces stellatus]|uniref:Aste57867_23237 protein n=1 Tax=Aphanomyces stellatus TaxID=120398 RepID=A0A485LP24_9STRA|nr:hypothetical protein As57867_023166 [Aphanomyces stellatus]VFT99882.1 Aste57867_23237 [Aphanomyces stellatus]